MGRAVSPLVNNQDAAGPTGPREPAAQEQGCRVLAALEGTDGLTDPARQYHDNQHQENDPTKTTTDCRPTKVKTASATIAQDDPAWLSRIGHDRYWGGGHLRPEPNVIPSRPRSLARRSRFDCRLRSRGGARAPAPGR